RQSRQPADENTSCTGGKTGEGRISRRCGFSRATARAGGETQSRPRSRAHLLSGRGSAAHGRAFEAKEFGEDPAVSAEKRCCRVLWSESDREMARGVAGAGCSAEAGRFSSLPHAVAPAAPRCVSSIRNG